MGELEPLDDELSDTLARAMAEQIHRADLTRPRAEIVRAFRAGLDAACPWWREELLGDGNEFSVRFYRRDGVEIEIVLCAKGGAE